MAISPVFGQGAIFDEEVYNTLPRTAPLAASSYEGLPSSFSLKQYAPLPGDQEDYGTCVGWAAGYAARTISESVALNRLNQTETTQNAFSPIYIYRNIRPDDPTGRYGAQIYSALDLMREFGIAKMLEIERNLSFPNVQLTSYKNSRKYPIGGYVTLFSRDDRRKPALITRIVKKSLSEGKPVIIGMNTPYSFTGARNVWEPSESPERFYYGHALCVVGYDDNKYGGAFEVMNSWGRKWGNGGYMWIPYQTFVNFVKEGYELIENIGIYSDTIRYEGFVRIDILDSNTFKSADFFITREGYLKTVQNFLGGTRFRYVLGSSEKAYVYTFSVFEASDDNVFYSPSLLFPQPRVSALLNYSDSMIILPGDDAALALNEQAGIEYIITLFSKQSLDIHGIMRDFESARGTITKRLAAAVGDNLSTALIFNDEEAVFSLSLNNPYIVAALITAIEHH
ncbi:MAG: C1 family peptidase [Treponema sp.]|nr:C1 family peptidase [Treponema sp.]